MKRKVLLVITLVITLIVCILHLSGNGYIIKALVYNFVNIDDYTLFHNREILAGRAEPWKKELSGNKREPSNILREHIDKTRTTAFLIIQNKKIQYEWYASSWTDTSRSSSFSVAKSYVGAAIGVALDKGLIKNLDEPLGEFIPEFASGEKSKITIRHALMMSTGLDWDETYASLFNPVTKAYYGTNLYKQIANVGSKEAPGINFNYQSCNTQLLGFVIEKISGQSLSDFISENIWIKTGAEYNAWWSLDKRNGHEKAYSAIYSNARDFARLGQLYLDTGRWNGQQLISQQYILESIVPAPLLDNGKPNKVYGYQWWCDEVSGVPVFYARGILGQYIFVIPEIQLVCVRLGHERSEDRDEVGNLIETKIYLSELYKSFGEKTQ